MSSVSKRYGIWCDCHNIGSLFYLQRALFSFPFHSGLRPAVLNQCPVSLCLILLTKVIHSVMDKWPKLFQDPLQLACKRYWRRCTLYADLFFLVEWDASCHHAQRIGRADPRDGENKGLMQLCLKICSLKTGEPKSSICA